MYFQDTPALRRCQLTAPDFLLGTGNFQRDPVPLHVEVASTQMGESGWVKGNGWEDKGRWVNISFLWSLSTLARSQRPQCGTAADPATHSMYFSEIFCGWAQAYIRSWICRAASRRAELHFISTAKRSWRTSLQLCKRLHKAAG